MKSLHATEFLKSPTEDFGPVVVVFGDQRSLKTAAIRVLQESVFGDNDDAVTRYQGKNTEIRSVTDELATVSMWADRRMVIVEDADDFITANRAILEKYLKKPAKKSILVLDVKTWKSNTRLAKRVVEIGTPIECSKLEGRALAQWMQQSMSEQHGKQLTRDAISLLSELAGDNLSLVEQELAKLASYVGDRPKVDVEDVRKLVGGWKAETTWVMLNAVRDGRLNMALSSLEKLLIAGEAPQRILGAINFVFRRLAKATEISRQGAKLDSALRSAGVFPRDVEPSGRYLRRIGRPTAECLLSLLLQADADMKGASRLPERLQLEQLLIHLNGAN